MPTKLSKTENPFKHILGFKTDLFVQSFIDLITEDLLQTRCCVQHSDNMTKTKPPLREHVKGLMAACIGWSVEEEKGTHIECLRDGGKFRSNVGHW